MEKLFFKLENCYGIRKFDQEIDFKESNISIIYAQNGLMKSSLANTLRDIHDGKEIKERVFNRPSSYSIKDENNQSIDPSSIIVINPISEGSCDAQNLLMANESLKESYETIHKNIDNHLTELYLQIKNDLKYNSRQKFNAKETLLNDFGKTFSQEYDCLKEIFSLIDNPNWECALDYDSLDYGALFNDDVLSRMSNKEIIPQLKEYERQYSDLIKASPFMKNGIIDFNNYQNINKSLVNNNYFKVKNELILNSKNGDDKKIIASSKEFTEFIENEKKRILEDPNLKNIFEEINTFVTANKSMSSFNNFLNNHQEIILEYSDVKNFKKKVWIKVFAKNKDKLKLVLDEYEKAISKLKEIRTAARKETTTWENTLKLFKERFYVPYTIEAGNKDDVILNDAVPSFKYIYVDRENNDTQELSKESLIDIVSIGERRAYYILNMIFKILIAKKEKKENLLILDDISESFDYRNKYAIIEYIKDIANYELPDGKKQFKILLLTHNFDFYRTVSSRLIQTRKNEFIAYSCNGKICLENGQYTGNVFSYFKKKLSSTDKFKFVIASIPFVRNLIEYTHGDSKKAYNTLTCLLHFKKGTKNITLTQLEDIYNEYWTTENDAGFSIGNENIKVYDLIISEADKINNEEKINIENKLILSMAIRLKAEEYIIYKLIEKAKNENKENEIEEEINNISKNQTNELIQKYRSNFEDNVIDELEIVNLITPENIHINSFMFEPILDMSVKQLYDQYQNIKALFITIN